MRAVTAGTTLPIDPIFRRASLPSRMQVTGDISVCPNDVMLRTPGNVSLMALSTVSEAGGAPPPAEVT